VRVHHIAFRTLDVERLADFYRDVVGLAETPAPRAGVCWLQAGEARLMIEPRGDGEPPVAQGEMDLVAFAIEPSERAGFEARLASHGVVIEGSTAFSVYFRDPDGRRVGVSHYPVP
jgi:catechol-2,3-dioxygenase